MSKKIIQSVKGFNDILDKQVAFFRRILEKDNLKS